MLPDFSAATEAAVVKWIADTVGGKSIAVGEDVLKTRSSFRTLPLLPSVEKLLLAEKEK